jgi:hypothetical protein
VVLRTQGDPTIKAWYGLGENAFTGDNEDVVSLLIKTQGSWVYGIFGLAGQMATVGSFCKRQ